MQATPEAEPHFSCDCSHLPGSLQSAIQGLKRISSNSTKDQFEMIDNASLTFTKMDLLKYSAKRAMYSRGNL